MVIGCMMEMEVRRTPTAFVTLVEQDPDGKVRAVRGEERPREQRVAVEELRVRRPPLLHAGLPVAPRLRDSDTPAGLNSKSMRQVGSNPCCKGGAGDRLEVHGRVPLLQELAP